MQKSKTQITELCHLDPVLTAPAKTKCGSHVASHRHYPFSPGRGGPANSQKDFRSQNPNNGRAVQSPKWGTYSSRNG